MIGNCAIYEADYPLHVGMNLLRIRPSSFVAPRFLFYCFRSTSCRHQVQTFAKPAINQASISTANLKRVTLPLPHYEAQKSIADFLDRETARIDQLIEKKERLVKLVRERSVSAIEDAISSEGEASKLGHHVRIVPGYAFASSDFSTDEGDIRLLRGANLAPGRIRWADVVYWPKEMVAGLERFVLSPGDIVMGMDRPWISSGIRVAEVTDLDVPCLLLQRVCKIIPLGTISKEFLKLLLSSKQFLGYFEPELTGVSVPHISGDQVAGFRFAYMPIERQISKSVRCVEALTRNEDIIRYVEKSNDRLREFRSALITAAVTGQSDVNTWSRRGSTDRRLDRIEEAMRA